MDGWEERGTEEVLDLNSQEEEQQIPKKRDKQLIVRIRSSYYDTKTNGTQYQRMIRTLSRKSTAHDFFKEDVHSASAEEAIKSIVNFHDVEDGMYELIVINVSFDVESGIPDFWEYKLIPYEEPEKANG